MENGQNPNPVNSSISGSDERIESSGTHSDCETPRANIFDPFAPASVEYERAPLRPNRPARNFMLPVCRKLDFDSCVDPIVQWLENDEDELVVNYLYHSFIDLIIGNESRVFLEGYSTPAATLFLTGNADRCPDVPVRPGPMPRLPLFDAEAEQSMCRKLDFDSC